MVIDQLSNFIPNLAVVSITMAVLKIALKLSGKSNNCFYPHRLWGSEIETGV